MKRVLGLVLAGLVGAGTLFSGVGVAHAEDEAIEETSVSEEQESEPAQGDGISEDTYENTENSLDQISEENNTDAEEQMSLMSVQDENSEYQEKVKASVSSGIEINKEIFPDDSLRHYVQSFVDKDYDNFLSEAEIEQCRIFEPYSNSNMKNFSGLELFYNISSMAIYLEEKDVILPQFSKFKNLEYLTIRAKEVEGNYYLGKSEEIEKCTSLESLRLFEVGIDSLNTSNMPYLKKLYIKNSNLESLDLSKNTALEEIYLENNASLTYVNFGNGLSNVYNIEICNSKLTELNVSKLPNLMYLDCNNNNITELDLSNNTSLKNIDCSYNNLTKLDASKNVVLNNLNCSHNNITDLKTPNYAGDMNISYNPLRTITFIRTDFISGISDLDIRGIDIENVKIYRQDPYHYLAFVYGDKLVIKNLILEKKQAHQILYPNFFGQSFEKGENTGENMFDIESFDIYFDFDSKEIDVSYYDSLYLYWNGNDYMGPDGVVDYDLAYNPVGTVYLENNPEDTEFFEQTNQNIYIAEKIFCLYNTAYNKKPENKDEENDNSGDTLDENAIAFKYSSGDKRDYSDVCYYTDSYFDKRSFGTTEKSGYQKSLATTTFALCMSAFSSNDNRKEQDINAKNLLEKMGFDVENDYYSIGYDKTPTESTIAACIASKPLNSNGKDYTLIALAVRGGGYRGEWAGNFNMGTSGQHEGFTIAKNQVINMLKKYIEDHKIKGDIKLWLTGYSRAAATANLVAGAIDDAIDGGDIDSFLRREQIIDESLKREEGMEVSLKKEDFYVYTFETPQGALETDVTPKKNYYNIFNIVNRNDIVPRVAMSALNPAGFKRYGVDFVLPDGCVASDTKYKGMLDRMKQLFNSQSSKMETGEYEIDKFTFKEIVSLDGIHFRDNKNISQSYYLDEFVDKITKENVKTRNNYVKSYQSAIMKTLYLANLDNSKEVFDSITKKMRDSFEELIVRSYVDIKYIKLKDRGYLIKNYFEKIIKESLTENGAEKYYNDKMVSPLTDLVLDFLTSHPNYTTTLIMNLNNIKTGHYGETCFAWLKSMDENYTPMESDRVFWDGYGQYKIVEVKCPVDVEVYNSSGNLVASIIGDKANENLDTTIMAAISSDDEKVVALPYEESYTIKLTATGDGTMDYTVKEYNTSAGDITRIDNFQDVIIKSGDVLYGGVPAFSEEDYSNEVEGTSTNYTLTGKDGNAIDVTESLKGEEAKNADYMIDISSENEECGIVLGQGIRTRGNYAQIEAVPNDGYKFIGWYEGDTLASVDVIYRFRVEGERSLVAKFEIIKEEATEPTDEPTEEQTDPIEEPTNPTNKNTQPTGNKSQPIGEPTTNAPASNNNGQANTSQPVVVKKEAAQTANVTGTVTKATTTGDKNYTALWISLSAAAAAAAITAGVVYSRKRKSN